VMSDGLGVSSTCCKKERSYRHFEHSSANGSCRKMRQDRVTLGVDCGSIEASKTTDSTVMRLRKELAARCTASYSSAIQEFAIVLRISGSVARFEGEGVQRLRVNRRDAYVTADFVVPEVRWDGVALEDIKRYFAAGAVETLRAMCVHLRKLKIDVDSERLVEDARKATASFLAGNSKS